MDFNFIWSSHESKWILIFPIFQKWDVLVKNHIFYIAMEHFDWLPTHMILWILRVFRVTMTLPSPMHIQLIEIVRLLKYWNQCISVSYPAMFTWIYFSISICFNYLEGQNSESHIIQEYSWNKLSTDPLLPCCFSRTVLCSIPQGSRIIWKV